MVEADSTSATLYLAIPRDLAIVLPDRPWSFGRSIALALIFLTMLAAPFTTRASHGERSLTSGGLDTQ